MRILLLPIVFLLASVIAFAQSESPDQLLPSERFPRAVGFSGGNLSGVGLSYRQWYKDFGVQAVLGGYYVPVSASSGGYTQMDYWVSAEVLYQLLGADFSNWFYSQLYLFAGIGHHGSIHPSYDATSATSIEGTYQAAFMAGGGIGIGVGWFQHLSTLFEIGYAVFWPLSVNLVIQGGIQYRF